LAKSKKCTYCIQQKALYVPVSENWVSTKVGADSFSCYSL
jgi:hypothetical protein